MKQVICDMCKRVLSDHEKGLAMNIQQTDDGDTTFYGEYDLCRECLDKFDQFLYSNSMKSEL